MVMRIVLSVVLLMSLPAMAYTKLTAAVNKNPVLEGEYFTLTIEADTSLGGEVPDTSALLKDFVVGPISRGSSTSIINGRMTQSTTWQMELMARRAGDLIIPAFKVKGKQSSPIALKVVKSQAAVNANDIYIETRLDPEDLYVQQAGVYTVKLFISKELNEGALSEPSAQGARLSQLNKQQENYEIIDGVRYMVVTREYLVQPQTSGEMVIKAPEFVGRIRENYRSLGRTATAPDTKVTVKPIPQNFPGEWLPSELVTLEESLSEPEKGYQVGTPITRTLTLTALGLTKEQLPAFSHPEVADFRLYPDKAESSHIARNGKVIAQRIESIALLPQKPGTFTLPKVQVPWFNTVTNRVEYAEVPEKTITVTGSALSTPNVSANAPEQVNVTSTQVPSTPSESHLPWWLITLTVVGWLGTLTFALLWLFAPNKKGVEPSPQASPNLNTKKQLIALQKALKARDSGTMLHALSALKPKAHTSVETWLSDAPDAQKVYQSLLHWHYKGAAAPSLDELKGLYLGVRKLVEHTQTTSVLAPLYPQNHSV